MKKVIIVSSYFPPSNLTSVHRARLFAMHLPSFGWEPIIVTTSYRCYEEDLDWGLFRLLPVGLRIEPVIALPTSPLRFVGDIGIRSFFPMLLKILNIIRKERIDFLYITIPSNYSSLLGRIVYLFTRTKYGIDYQDPWIYKLSSGERVLFKSVLSSWLARILEPIAVKKASLISGVDSRYYSGVFLRNPHLDFASSCETIALPIGGEKEDNNMADGIGLKTYLFDKTNKIDLVFAGTVTPKADKPLRLIFEAINSKPDLYKAIRIHFIGTGKNPHDERSFVVKPLAEEFSLWRKVVFEYPKRIPYLDVLAHLKLADGIFILGNTESHYTPSKVYQAILSGKPILAVLHKDCTVGKILVSSKIGLVLDFNGEEDLAAIRIRFNDLFADFITFLRNFRVENIDYDKFEEFSAYNITRALAGALDNITDSRI